MSPAHGPLHGTQVVSLALNLPGPLAAARLVELGATVTKVEPPSGDPLAALVPQFYSELAAGQQVVTLDLKSPAGRGEFDQLLASADILLTAQRPSALRRLGLDDLRLPRLCQVRIVGHSGDAEEAPGHDLTYQAAAGLIHPPAMPTVLLADLLGSERAVSAALAALVERAATGRAGIQQVALEDAAAYAARPGRHGMTGPGRPLSGGMARYNIYRAADGWIALAALEQHFWERFHNGLGVAEQAEEIEALIGTRGVAEWEHWAQTHDVPLHRVAGA